MGQNSCGIKLSILCRVAQRVLLHIAFALTRNRCDHIIKPVEIIIIPRKCAS